jgi:DNA (cytosine-5)-methyltransferase 1
MERATLPTATAMRVVTADARATHRRGGKRRAAGTRSRRRSDRHDRQPPPQPQPQRPAHVDIDGRGGGDGGLRVADFFCGAGGMSLGFRDAGYTPVLGVDWDLDALDTFRQNFPSAEARRVDLLDEAGQREAVALARRLGVDVVVGGPPCQGFSRNNVQRHTPRYQRVLNSLPVKYARMVRAIAPALVVMEEVRPFVTSDEYAAVLAELARDYHVEAKVLCAADYGVPQLRHRCIIVGVRRDRRARLDGPLHPPPTTPADARVTVGAALAAQKPARGAEVSEAARRWCAERQRGRIAGKCGEAAGDPEWHRNAYACVPLDEPSQTITTSAGSAGSGRFTFCRDGRFYRMSVEEAACLQSFPSGFRFASSSVGSAYRQVGNAVPPLLGRAIAAHLRPLVAAPSAHGGTAARRHGGTAAARV